jgi:O-antigen/teichoic acid export membrane protein
LTVRTRVLKQTSALGAGTVVGGLLAYAFFATATRSLGASDAAPVSVLWTYWTMAAAILTFPLQHWTIRLLTRGDEGTLARSQSRIWAGTAVVSAFSALLAYLARDVLFHDSTVAYPAMVAGITAGAALSGSVRGALAGRGRYAATGMSMATENLLRVALAVAVAIAGGGAVAFGLALVAGSFSAFLWPSSLRFGDRSTAAGESIASPLALVSGLAAGSLIAQVVLTGGPIALAAMGGTPRQVTSLFVTLAVWRAPYLVALGVAPRLTPALTRMTLARDEQRLRRARRWILLAVLGGSAVAFLVGATIVGPVLRVVFGIDVVLDWQTAALIGVGTAAAVGNLALLLLMLALGTSRPLNRAWLAAVVVVAAILVAVPVSPLNRVATAFVGAELTAFALLLAAPLRGREAPTIRDAAEATSETPPGT